MILLPSKKFLKISVNNTRIPQFHANRTEVNATKISNQGTAPLNYFSRLMLFTNNVGRARHSGRTQVKHLVCSIRGGQRTARPTIWAQLFVNGITRRLRLEVEKHGKRRKWQRSVPRAREKPGADWEKDLQTCREGTESRHERGPRWSWTRNQTGNSN
jgi:hypothetical protein